MRVYGLESDLSQPNILLEILLVSTVFVLFVPAVITEFLRLGRLLLATNVFGVGPDTLQGGS